MRLPICMRHKDSMNFSTDKYIFTEGERPIFAVTSSTATTHKHIHTQQNNQFVKMASTTASTNNTVYYIEHVLKSAR